MPHLKYEPVLTKETEESKQSLQNSKSSDAPLTQIDEDGDLIIKEDIPVLQHAHMLHFCNKPTDKGQAKTSPKKKKKKSNKANSQFELPQYEGSLIDWTEETEETKQTLLSVPIIQVVNEAKERLATEEAQKKAKEEELKKLKLYQDSTFRKASKAETAAYLEHHLNWCIFCKTDAHSTVTCSLAVAKKVSLLFDEQRCRVCMDGDHQSKHCPHDGSICCQVCGLKHLTYYKHTFSVDSSKVKKGLCWW